MRKETEKKEGKEKGEKDYTAFSSDHNPSCRARSWLTRG